MLLQRKHFRGTGRGGLQSNARKVEQCHGARGWRRHPLLMPLGDLHHPEALQFWGGEGRARPARGGALSHKILPGKKRRRPKWIWDYIESRIFLKSFISKGREEKNDFKKSNTWTRLLYSRGRQEYPQCVTCAARDAHSLAKFLKKRASLLLKKYCVSCEVDLFTY